MNVKRMIGIGVLSISILGLYGCGHSSDHQAGGSNQSGAAQSTDNSSGSQADNQASGTSGNQNQTGGNADNQSQTGQTTDNQSADNGSSSGSGNGGSDNTGSGQASQPSGPPSTQQDAFSQTAAALTTKVPLMLPTNVPLADGKYLTATTKSEQWYYKVQLFGDDQPTAINAGNAASGTPIATIEGTEYKDEASAKDNIAGWWKIDPPNDMAVDLGHGIVGVGEGATGHALLSWNEGRWTLRIDSPSDKAYINPDYKDPVKVAKDMVAYLENNALPAPQMIGVVSTNIWNNGTQTTVQWQYHQMVYQVTSKDPVTALKIAVAMKFGAK